MRPDELGVERLHMADISIIGAGYVGLTTGACFAHLGHHVTVADIVPEKIESLRRGEIPILEAGLQELVAEGLEAGNLHFVVGAGNACRDAEFHYLCVPTPQDTDGSADLSYLVAAAEEIKDILPAGSVVVNKSTVPVGTTNIVENVIQREDINVVSNPEFLREGTAVTDFLHPDRVVVGAEDQEAAIRVAGLYARVAAPVMVTDPVSSELIKYASNAFLAVKLTFVNEMANLCEKVGADIDDVTLGMGYDTRIGRSFLRPGPGWGGSCFPKDAAALVRIAESAGCELDFIEQAIALNSGHFQRTADKVAAAVPGGVENKTVGAWGLTFKAGTDDLRESPAIEVLTRLMAMGARIQAYDPAVHQALDSLPEVRVVDDPYTAAEGADVLVVLTEWSEFKSLNFDKVGELMTSRTIVDARNLLDRSALKRRGFTHIGMGR
jgi:UDPglucose 6-dehydrogenase